MSGKADKQPKMGKSKIDYRNEHVKKYYSWNPGGFGCSNLPDCPGCWSKGTTQRCSEDPAKFCPDCKAFRVHLHEERLAAPMNTQKPGVVLVNFTCDTFDKQRSDEDISKTLQAAQAAPQHTYIFLTKQAARMRAFFEDRHALTFMRDGCLPDNWYFGLTVRNQADAEEKWNEFIGATLHLSGKRWLSLEPLWDGVDLTSVLTRWHDCFGDEYFSPMNALADGQISGVIIGHDNRANGHGTKTLRYIRSAVRQCEAAGVKVFVKQLWLWVCDRCGCVVESLPDGGCPDCGEGVCQSVRLRRSLAKDPLEFPPDLRCRDLPWTFPKEPNEGEKL